MRSNYILETAAAVFLSVQSISSGVHASVEITGVDPENYVSKQVSPEIARGGMQKLQDQGVLRFENEIESTKDDKLNRRKLGIGEGGLRNRSSGGMQQGTGAGQNVGGVDARYHYETYDDYGTASYDDDNVVAEEIITMEYYQDNRFSTPDPIYANPQTQSREATGNRWLYANVPLQPIFGINDLPIQGLAQGFCESLFEDQDGFCHFTYEFFDLRGGAIVVYASITAEGATVPQGPSTLNIIGGTGEFSGAVGELTLWPVGIDESTIPARIFKDGSLFLGNRNGYEAKFDMAVRYLLNEPVQIPVPVSQPVAAPIPVPVQATAGSPIPEPTAVDQQSALAGPGLTWVTCPGQVESEYCDCDMDCGTTSARCACEEAQACCSAA